MRNSHLFPSLYAALIATAQNLGWHFVQNGTSGIVALEAIVVSPTLAVFFDRATNDPLQVNGHTAWAALWNFETNTASPLDIITDSFCASGALLSNGTMVSTSLWITLCFVSEYLIRLVLGVISLPFPKLRMEERVCESLNHATIRQVLVAKSSKTQKIFTSLKIDGIHLQ